MAILKRACANCGHDVAAHVGQRVTDRGVAWHASYTCGHCGKTIEEDDVGPTPQDIRSAILDNEGTYQVAVASTVETLKVIKALRDALNLTLEEANEYRKRLPGALTTGTHAEMKWLASRLQRENIPANVTKVEP